MDNSSSISRNNQGFTLIELIVVLVILGILAAILIPGLLGYIDEAKRKQEIIDAKALRTAIQSQLSLEYAKAGSNFSSFDSSQDIYFTNSDFSDSRYNDFVNAIFEKSGVDPDPFLLIFYTLKVDGSDYNSSGNADRHGAFTCISVVYWKDKDSTPIYYDFVNNQWKEGSPYSDDLVRRGSNEVQKGIYQTKKVRVCIVTSQSQHVGQGNTEQKRKDDLITKYNNMILKVMGYKRGGINWKDAINSITIQ